MRTVVAVVVALCACKGKPAKRDDARVTPADDVVALVADASIDAPAKAARPEHAVWKLVDNRHTAHRYIGGELVLDARSIGFARYTRFGMPKPQWQLGATVAGERAAIAERLASLEIPIVASEAAPTQLTARVWASDKRALEVRVNGRKAGKTGRVALEAGWQTVALALDPDAMRAGENVLALQTIGRGAQKLALAWLRAGTSHPAADEDPLAAAAFDVAGDALELASGASLAWYVMLPEGAHLVADVAAPCLVDVGARANDDSYTGGLLAADQDRVDLSSVAGKVVRLTLTPRDCPRARIVAPRITIHGPAPIARPPADPPRYVLVWKLASLRDDPGFEDLARASTVFRQFAWDAVDRPALGKAISTPTKLHATLIADATVDILLAHFDSMRDKPFFLYADTSRDPGPQLARVIAQLKSWGLWDQTLVIAADAGELAIHDAARFPSGTIVDEGAEASDLVPTVLAALGQVSDTATGASLAPLAQGIGRGWPRPTYTMADDATHVLRIGRWTIRVGRTGVPVVGDDPGGALNLASVRPTERRMLTDYVGLLLPLREQWRKAEWGVVSNLSPAGARALDEAAAP